MLQRCS